MVINNIHDWKVLGNKHYKNSRFYEAYLCYYKAGTCYGKQAKKNTVSWRICEKAILKIQISNKK